MQKFFDTVLNRRGEPVRNASVLVKTDPGGVVATIYSDNGVTAASNPLTTDENGYFEFFAADGRYQIVISGVNVTARTIGGIVLDDSANSSTAFSAVASGAADAMTATLSSVTSYSNFLELNIRAPGANTVTAPTININSLGAKIITKLGGEALAVGDYEADQEIILRYNAISDKFELVTPVQAQYATLASLSAHINDATAAHAASAISNTPAGNLAATDVQAALNELDSEKLSSGAGAVGTVNLDDGSVTTAKIDDAAVTVAKLSDAAATGIKNYIINGGCQIAQTGYIAVAPGANTFIVGGTDMAVSAFSTATSLNVGNVANSVFVSGYGHQAVLSSAGAGTVAAGFRIEGADSVELNGKQVTFKCKAYQNSGGALQARLRIRKPSALDDFTTLTTIATGADFSVADSTGVDASLTATLGASDATNGLQVDIEYTTAGAVTSKSFQLGDVRLVEGPTAPDMVLEDKATTLSKCEYRLQVWGGSGVTEGPAAVGVTYNASSGILPFPYKRTMAGVPTMVVSGTWTLTTGNAGGTHTSMALNTYAGVSAGELVVIVGTAPFAANTPVWLRAGSGATILLDKRLK